MQVALHINDLLCPPCERVLSWSRAAFNFLKKIVFFLFCFVLFRFFFFEIKASDKILRRFDLAEIIFKHKKDEKLSI